MRIDLTNQGLTRLPEDLDPQVEVLDVSGNQLEDLPEDLPRLTRLRVLFASGNPFTRLPPVLGRMPSLRMVGFKSCRLTDIPAESLPPHLRWLILTDNAIEQLPERLGACPDLEKVALAGNRLSRLPDLSGCHRLALLRLGANRFTTLPPWLASLPHLAWLGFGGNPLTAAPEAVERPLPPIAWSDLTLGPVLGQGASGVIHRAEHAHLGAVALKLFKGAVTSDGLPATEQATWIAAGDHPHRIGLLGRIIGHPQGTPGLVMPLVPPEARRLGDPPSLATCSRDTYPEDLRLTLTQVRTIVLGVAETLADLHAQGLLHGDLYAHNLLVRPDGHPLLGDFGAASFLPADHAPLAATEIRALACLLEDLLDRTTAPPAALAPWRAMQIQWSTGIPSQRPSAQDICRQVVGFRDFV